MTRDLSRVKVLMTHSKSLTPAQQNWPPLIQEAFAQLEMKRATRRTFGSIRTVCWTDHANLTRAQTSDIGLDPKLVISEDSTWTSTLGRVPRALGRCPGRSVATPFPDTVDRAPVAVPVAVATEVPVRVMVVFDYLRWSEQDAALVEIQSAFQRSLPGLSCRDARLLGPVRRLGGPRFAL